MSGAPRTRHSSARGAAIARPAIALATTLVIALAIGAGPGCRGREHDDRAEPSPDRDRDRGAQDRAQRMLDRADQCAHGDRSARPATCDEACELGHSNSCHGAGALREAAADDAAAWTLYTRACDGGSGLGCESAARLRRIGRAGPADAAAADALDRRARFYLRVHCEQGHGPSCLVLGQVFQSGRGGAADRGSSATFLARACHLGLPEACPPPVDAPGPP